MALAAGAAGGNIEDFTGERARPLYDPELAADRIRAARAALDAAGEPFVLIGRTDALLVGGSLDECVRRANAYLAAGADCAFVPGAVDAATIGTLVRELDGPLNVVMGLTGNSLSLDDLRALGVRRVTVGGSIARATYGHILRAARELADHGTFSYADAQIPHGPQRPFPARPRRSDSSSVTAFSSRAVLTSGVLAFNRFRMIRYWSVLPSPSKPAFARGLPSSAAARSSGTVAFRCDSYAASHRPSALAASASASPGAASGPPR